MSASASAPLAWLFCLVWTLAFELPIASILLRGGAPSPLRRRLAVVLVANLLTHPLVWAAFHQWPLLSVAAGAELFAVMVEAVAYARWLGAPWPLAIGVSLVANGASLGACLPIPIR